MMMMTTPMTTPNKRILHEFFEHAAGLFPEHVAVSTDARDIRYAALDALSGRVAEMLLRLGVRREEVVAVYLDKGIEYVAAILGVMKAGAVFLPLDLGLAPNRLAFMLAKTPPKIVITCQKAAGDLIPHLASDPAPAVMHLEADESLVVARPSSLPIPDSAESEEAHAPPRVDPKDACYIVYTSGSTGNPKAVVGVHQSLSHFIHWEAKEFGFNEVSRVSQFPPVSFDASLKDIFVPLVAGGRVCIPPRSTLDSGANLVSWLERQQITVMHCVPALFRLVLRELEERAADATHLPALRQVIIAGDVLFASDVLRWRARVGGRVPLANLYGLTETTILKTFHRIEEVPQNPREIIHVGQPIANTAVLIEKDGRLCEIGQIGELYIKSPFLTRGYLDNDEPTNNRFVENPLTREPQDIVFKTGDLGRYRADRSIEILGRLDTQVKIQGNRVELSEIEKNLLAFAPIDQAVVMALKGEDGDHTLACYYTEKEATSSEAIRAYLSDYLPAYMIPSFFLRMDKFPLNINGKINRKALPRPEQVIFGTSGHVAPETEIERGLEAIWREVLALEKVSVTAPFFDVGGHSLKATRILSRIGRAFDVDLSLASFFENDTIRKLAARIEGARTPACPAIPAIPDADDYPVSHGQYRLWALDQIDEHRIAYSMPGAYLFEGALDRELLRRAFAALIARHESLRTTFEIRDGELRQRVHADLPGGRDIETVDLRGRATGDETDEAVAARVAREDALRPFDLKAGPLLRVKLLRLTGDRHVVLLNVHHIICDGWSIDTLGREWAALYEAYAAGKADPLPPLKIQYRDYAAWQNRLLASDEGRALAAHWHGVFAQPAASLDLPTDFPRPPVSSYRGATLHIPLDHDLAERWTALAKAREATLFQSLTALAMTLLYHYTGQEDILIGTPVAGRSHPDLEPQVGFFVNMLALREPVRGADSFSSLLARVKQTATRAYDHQAYPFDRLVDELHLKRQANRAPLFDVMIALESPELPDIAASKLRIRELPLDTGTTRMDLTLVFVAQPGGLELKVNFSPDLFAADRIQRMGEHLQALMRGVLAEPDRSVGSLDLLPEAERTRVLESFQGEARAFPLDRTLIDLFSERAAAAPDRLGLIYEGQELTYGELRRRAATVARQLLDAQDIRPGDRVGLMVDRSEASVIGLLGVLMAGGVFVPLDPSYPRQRLELMLADSECKVVLAQPKYRALCGAAVPVSEYVDATEPAEVSLPARERDPRAAILFTSGSTGKPKGIQLSHKGLINTAYGLIETFAIGPDDRVLQFAAYSFDIFLAEVWMTLLAGACLVVADRRRIDDPRALLAYLDEKKVTLGSMPTAYLNALNKPTLKSFRLLITGGEAPSVAMARHHASGGLYFNAYGLTETSAYSTLHRVDPARAYPQSIPIGAPLPNTRVYILDAAMRPRPIGMTGEICIGGAGVAMHYVKDPERTAARFVPDPFRPGERLYKTGDIGRFLGDGQIEFLGRADTQVKVRGHRVELGEIERALLTHPAVKESFVTQVDAAGELAAYWVGQGEAIDAGSLRAHLARSLPDFMIPAHVVRVDHFPLSSTGKIDGAALPNPRTVKAGTAAEGRSCTALERRILELWEKVLDVRDIDVDTDFFALGGHSIHVVSLISQLSDVVGAPVSPKQIYLNPTVASLARALETTNHPGTVIASAKAAARATRSGATARVERRPLLSLMATGALLPVDAVALDYLSDDLTAETGASRQEIIEEWCGGLPVFSGVRELPAGRIGLITLPRFGAQLFGDPAGLFREMDQALTMAAWIGAGAVSLTGWLASATDYGRALAPLLARARRPLRLTTGHATVVAALLASLEGLLAAAGRRLEDERVGVLGLGSIGAGVLRLMLDNLAHPPALSLFDVHRGAHELDDLRASIAGEHRYAGELRVLPSAGEVPDAFYDATLILSATNARELLDVDRIAPGALLLTDSGRHGFAMERALARLTRDGDLLVSEGDLLHLASTAPSTVYLPERVEAALSPAALQSFLERDLTTITGCSLAALLTAQQEGAVATLGPVTTSAARAHRDLLTQLGLKAAPPHVDGTPLSSAAVAAFRARFGHTTKAATEQAAHRAESKL